MSRLQLPKIIGHRGACYYAPENTLASLRKAKALGASWVEFDVMLTQDNHAVVIHDETLNRTTNGRGDVANSLYAEIAQLDAGSWFAPEFRQEKIPTFSDYLTCAQQLGLSLNIEIKPTPDRGRDTALQVVDALKMHWQNPAQTCLVSSFCVESLQTARAQDAELNLALLLDRWADGWQTLLTDLHCVSLNMKQSLLTAARVAEAKQYVPYVLAYTVNDKQLAQQLFDMGVDAVFSDRPDLLL
jgi:glycerophosphoryl diester phosphodiesterase